MKPARYIGRLVPRLMEDANQLFSAGNAQKYGAF